MGEMKTMGVAGDSKIEWNPDNAEEVAIARAAFDLAVRPRRDGGKGYNAYRVGERGRPGEVIRSFDPRAAKLILAPPMAGGSCR
jgi:hypothetical protein